MTEVKSNLFFLGSVMKEGSRRYWLMKSEPNCFSFDDLKRCPDPLTEPSFPPGGTSRRIR